MRPFQELQFFAQPGQAGAFGLDLLRASAGFQELEFRLFVGQFLFASGQLGFSFERSFRLQSPLRRIGLL